MARNHELDVGKKCIKYMMFISNLMFVLVGFLLLSIGTTIVAIYSDFDGFMRESYFSPAKLTIAIGILIFFVSIFGCLGALKESVLLINIFAFFLTVIFVLEVAACITAYVMRYNLEQKIERSMTNTMKSYTKNDEHKYYWDSAQDYLQCCGINDPLDWKDQKLNATKLDDILNINEVGQAKESYFVPESCCKSNANCPRAKNGTTPKKNIFQNGCVSRLTYIVSECAFLLGVGCFSVALIQILGIAFARILAKSIRRIKTEMLVECENRRRQLYNTRLPQNIGTQDEKPKGPVLEQPTSSEA